MYTTRAAMEEEGFFGKSWLGLGIGSGGGDLMKRSRAPVQFDLLFQQTSVKEEEEEAAVVRKKAEKGSARKRPLRVDDGRRQSSSSSSHGPSPSDGGGGEDDGGAVDGAAGAGTRKKLRLTKEQSTLLEDTFRAHNILSHAQKQQLARQVNLSARQVEVWFQNRRARTKLKQTEVDCEILKRCCESLTGENQRLRLELAQLQRSTAAAGLCYVQSSSSSFPPPATATASVVCPSCDKVTVTSGGGETSGKSSSYSS